MVGPNKILTVSYGTFSCTLEGFDDPFSTMRGISEYFRDLAAEDRYFGAEPPTPDAEMLHRIAEKEVQRRVEAHVDESGVTLRQLEPTEVVEDVAPTPSVAPALAAVKAAAEVEIIEEPVPEARRAPVAQESVAAKLARIRAVVSDDAEEEYVDEGFATTSIEAAFDDVTEEVVEDTIAETEPEVVEEVADAVEVEAIEEVEMAATEVEEAEIEVVEIEATEPFVEEAVEEVFEETEIVAADDAEPETWIEEEAEDDVNVAEASEDAVSRLMAAVSAAPVEEDTEVEEVAETDAEPDQATIARVVKMRRSDFEAAVAEGNLEEVHEDDTIDLEAVQNAIEEPSEPESSLSAEDEAELMSTLEQVQREADAERRAEKEGRAILENTDEETNTNSVARILEVTNSEMEETEGTRRRSAIAHLKAAVAATRADKFLKKKQEEDEESDLNQYRDDLARVVRPKRPPEAQKVERRLAPLMLVSEQRIDPVSAAAAAVVRPRRVTSVGIAAEDEEFAAEGAEDNIFRDAGSFAEFAEEMGASELPDLLEAAAAYYAFVERREHFSRPQIMQVVASVDKNKVYTREEGLRSFGMLLRRGKIQKIKRGQFKIANSTRFNPEARAAGE
ncbi:MAG: hypothetical protein ACU0CA_18040 [Paracoccaceae bacterium]